MVRSQKQSKWLLYYQGFLTVGAILFFFTFFDSYIVVQQIASSPVGWMLPYFALTIPLFILGKLKIPLHPIILWCVGYFLISVLSFLFFPTSESSSRSLIDRSFSSLFVLVTTCLFMDQRIQNRVRSALIVATLIGVLNNFYQFVNPYAFAGLLDGRVSGFYMDPNDCSYALILGMILTVGRFPQKFRIPWVLTVGLGVGITLSRGGTLSWIVAVMLMGLTGIIASKQFWFWFLGIGALLLVLILSGSGDSFNLNLDAHSLERVNGIFSGETLNDPSAVERKGILAKARDMFLEHPLFGEGIGSTSDYSITGFSVSTHNMYLLHAAEYGIAGIPILPLAIYAATHRASGETRKIAIIFTLFVLLSSCFSHTVLDQRSYLLAFSLMAMMSATSQIHSDFTDEVSKLRTEKLP